MLYVALGKTSTITLLQNCQVPGQPILKTTFLWQVQVYKLIESVHIGADTKNRACSLNPKSQCWLGEYRIVEKLHLRCKSTCITQLPSTINKKILEKERKTWNFTTNLGQHLEFALECVNSKLFKYIQQTKGWSLGGCRES